MARRVFSFPVRSEGGPVLGGSATELRIYDDAALTTLSTIYAGETGAGTLPNPRIPNAGRQTALLADRASGDAYVTVVDITGFAVGDLIPIYNGTVTVYRVITLITAGTRRFDLGAPLGAAFLASNTVVGNLDMRGHVYGWLDDVRDYYMQAKNVASGRVLAPVGIPVRVPSTVLATQEEGVTVGTRGITNYIGAGITAVDDAANARINVTHGDLTAHSGNLDIARLVNTARTADVQVFTASGTWTKPAGAKAVAVICFGAGGGGGGGRGGGAATIRDPGAAGGGGAYRLALLDPSGLGATETITVGASGTAGAGGANANGGNGGVGGGSSFGPHVAAYGGGGGPGGGVGANLAGGGGGGTGSAGATAVGGTPGVGGAPRVGGASGGDMAGGSGAYGASGGSDSAGSAEHGGGGGGPGNNNNAGFPGGGSLAGGGGGGGAGGLSSGNVEYAGAAGGANGAYARGGGGAAGAVNGGAGGAGTSRSGTGRAGDGGGGGGGQDAGTGGAGGAGGIPAGGGGGGAGGTVTGGAGGLGGRGEVIVVTYF